MEPSGILFRGMALLAATAFVLVSCSPKIPDTKKGIMDAFVAAHGER